MKQACILDICFRPTGIPHSYSLYKFLVLEKHKFLEENVCGKCSRKVFEFVLSSAALKDVCVQNTLCNVKAGAGSSRKNEVPYAHPSPSLYDAEYMGDADVSS